MLQLSSGLLQLFLKYPSGYLLIFFLNFPGGFFGAEWDFGAVGFTSIASLAAQPSTSITPQPFEATPVSVPPILFRKNNHSCCRN